MPNWIAAVPGGLWGIVGTLFGAVLTYAFTRHSQQQRWVADSKKQEYREILDALVYAESELAKDWRWQDLGLEADEIFKEVFNKVHLVLRDRIFVGEVIERDHVHEKWIATVSDFQRDLSVGEFRVSMDKIRQSIMKAARKDLEI